jgi:tight adherence protein B
MPVSLPMFLILFTFTLLSVAMGLKFYEWWRKREMSARLRTLEDQPQAPPTALLRERQSGHQRLEHWLERLSLLERFEKLIRQSGVNWTVHGLLVLMSAGILSGIVLSCLLPPLVDRTWSGAVLAILLGSLPHTYLRRKRARRLAAFEEQFPEALDFLARSMRAGHAFTISLRMVSEDLPDPLGLEFRTLFNEQNLGAPLEIALQNLAQRVPLLEVRFFVSAVTLQKQTGGNLGEILTRLGQVIRERFRLKGQVRAASAHGRVTSLVLTILPVATAVLMMMVAPNYLRTMLDDPDGKWLIAGSIVAQLFGQWVIRKIIRIKV